MNTLSLKMSLASILISGVSLMAHAAGNNDSFAYGALATTDQPVRTVVVSGNPHQSIDVQKNETVDLVSGNTHEAWRFDGVQPQFTLAHIFPAAAHANSIRVYVADPDHQG